MPLGISDAVTKKNNDKMKMYQLTWLLLLPFIDAYGLNESLDYNSGGEFADDPKMILRTTERILEGESSMIFENVTFNEKNAIFDTEDEDKAEKPNSRIIEDELSVIRNLEIESPDDISARIYTSPKRSTKARKSCQIRSGGASRKAVGTALRMAGRRNNWMSEYTWGNNLDGFVLDEQGLGRERPLPKHGEGSVALASGSGGEMVVLFYDTTVRTRYVRTRVTGIITIYDQPTTININEIIPREAYITEFTTNVNGRKVEASVKSTKVTSDLKNNQAIGVNLGTILVEVRDQDGVTLAVAVPRYSTIVYTIVYEYLVERNEGVYTVPVTIHTNMWIEDLLVRWRIHEDRELTRLETPLMYGPTALPKEKSVDPMVCILNKEAGGAEIIWQPTIEEQKNISRRLETKKDGIVGTLEVRYEVMRLDDSCGQVVIEDEHFVHFLSPPDEPTFAKHVVFVLDVSSSMSGMPLEQLKAGVCSILDTLQPSDHFTLINFAGEVHIIDIHQRSSDIVYKGSEPHKTKWPKQLPSYQGTAGNITAAKEAMKFNTSREHTNIYDALMMGFKAVFDVAAMPPAPSGQPHLEPFIFFLTDGHANYGPSFRHRAILRMIKNQNRLAQANVIAIGFGNSVDRKFIKSIAFVVDGTAKHVYKDKDAGEQVSRFYKSSSAPVLKNIRIKYDPRQVLPEPEDNWLKLDVPNPPSPLVPSEKTSGDANVIKSTVTDQSFSMLHVGKELTSAGKLNSNSSDSWTLRVIFAATTLDTVVTCERYLEEYLKDADRIVDKDVLPKSDKISKNPFKRCRASPSTIERIWAFKTLNHLQNHVPNVKCGSLDDYRCEDPQMPFSKMMEICLRMNYAMPTITDLIYDGTVVQRFSISPEREDETNNATKAQILTNMPWYAQGARTDLTLKVAIRIRGNAIMWRDLLVGTDESSPDGLTNCTNAYGGGSGVCRYIPNCPDIRTFGVNEIVARWHCPMKEYVGVCCPN